MSSLKSITRFLYQIADLFAIPIKFRIQKQELFHSSYGLIASLAIYAVTLSSFVSLSSDLFSRSNPNIVQNVNVVQDPLVCQPITQEYQLDASQFIYFVSVVDIYTNPIVQSEDNIYFILEASTCQRNILIKNQTQNCKSVMMAPCQYISLNSNLVQVWIYFTKNMNISTQLLGVSYCVDQKDWDNLSPSIQGQASSDLFKSITIVMNVCSQNLLNQYNKTGKCASKQAIDQKLVQGYLGVTFSNYILNQQQSGNPYKVVSKLVTTQFSLTQIKTLNVIMQRSILINIENFYQYFPQREIFSVLTYSNSYEFLILNESPILSNILFYFGDQELNFQRSYDNILNILGSVSGLMNLLMLFTTILVNPIVQFIMNLALIDQVFQFQGQVKYNQVQQDEDSSFNNKRIMRILKLKHQQLKLTIFSYFSLSKEQRNKIRQSISLIENTYVIQAYHKIFIELYFHYNLTITQDISMVSFQSHLVKVLFTASQWWHLVN